MSKSQLDLFAATAQAKPRPSAEILALVCARPYAAPAFVKSADAVPRPDTLSIIRKGNEFRYGRDILPPDEGAALWAEFDVEMHRLYAVMNEGKELDPLD